MKKSNIYFAVVLMFGLTACGNSVQSGTETNTDSNAAVEGSVVDSTSEISVEESNCVDFDQMEKTARMVFAMVMPQGVHADDFEGIVASKCTTSFIDALKAMDEFDEGNIAWYALRTMEQEGPSDISEILDVKPDGNDAVIVNYSDMGHKASTRLVFVKNGDDYKVNSAVVTYKGQNREIK